MFKQQLINLGLTEKESLVYEALLKLGPSSISPILKESRLKKGDCYNILRALKEKKLISESGKERKSIFLAEPPQKLQEIILNRKQAIDEQVKELNVLLPSLTSLFQTTTEKPIIQILTGLEGAKIFYDQLVESKTEVLILVSRYDREDPEHEAIIEKNMLDQFKAGVRVRALNPLQTQYPISGFNDYLRQRKAMNIDMRMLPPDFTLPSKIIIYDNKVGISSVKKELVTTLIENENIANAFRIIFEYMWQAAESYTEKLKKESRAAIDKEAKS